MLAIVFEEVVREGCKSGGVVKALTAALAIVWAQGGRSTSLFFHGLRA